MPNRQDVRHNVWLSGEFAEAEGRGELSIAYQPIVDMQTRRIVGAEALMRWHHGTRGAVSPNTFIGLAEPEGLLHGPGAFAIETALDDLAIWRAASDLADGLFVSVNVSPSQLEDQGLIDGLITTLDSRGLDAGDLHLELTETAPPPGPSGTAMLNRLHGAGFHIAIDDFGTGYSSLLRVQHLPCRSLKIDRGFTTDLATSATSRAIVRSTLQLARDMGLDVVAEGIETEDQRDFLHDNGCPMGQGYLFGKPATSDDFRRAFLNGSLTP
ncbi:MAG: EAL domain-containing protein [Minwuia sp.]|nr:EAL domain-containing protein [Minwuia sp.]